MTIRHFASGGSRPATAAISRLFRRSRAVLGAVLALLAAPAWAAPHVPSDDSQVLERLAEPGDPTRRELRRLRAEIKRQPNDLVAAARLARRHIELGRTRSDPRQLGYAEAALAPWWSLAEPPVAALVLRASIKQSRHEFATALADLDQAVRREPRNAQAWLTRAVVLQVMGKPRAAAESCARLAPLTTALISATCLAGAASLDGRAAAAEQALAQALGAARPDDDPAIRLWAWTTRAEIAARRGDAPAAERHFRAALGLGLRDDYLLAAYSDFLLDQGRAADARSLLQAAARTDPLLLRLALAERQVGGSALPSYVAELLARFAASRQRGEALHKREEARFALSLLDEPAEALALARANWAVQREPWDARLVLETALAAGRPEAAADVIAWLDSAPIEDGRLRRLARQVRETRS